MEKAGSPLPLTRLSEDESLFRESVLEFAAREIKPLVREMDDQAKMPRPLIDRLFQLGVMGIEIPDALGGAGGTFFHSVLAVEALSSVDPSVGVLVDVQNTLVINALLRWGSNDQQERYLPQPGGEHCRRVCALGSRVGQRRLRADDPRRGIG